METIDDGELKEELTEGLTGRTCGARTRAGTPCQRSPMRNGRCNNHGGKSHGGIGHPNFKHGLYSKCVLGVVLREQARQARHEARVGEKRRALARQINDARLAAALQPRRGRPPKTVRP